MAVAVPLWMAFFSLAMRIGGDLADLHGLRRLGSIGNATALPSFAVTLASGCVAGRRRPQSALS